MIRAQIAGLEPARLAAGSGEPAPADRRLSCSSRSPGAAVGLVRAPASSSGRASSSQRRTGRSEQSRVDSRCRRTSRTGQPHRGRRRGPGRSAAGEPSRRSRAARSRLASSGAVQQNSLRSPGLSISSPQLARSRNAKAGPPVRNALEGSGDRRRCTRVGRPAGAVGVGSGAYSPPAVPVRSRPAWRPPPTAGESPGPHGERSDRELALRRVPAADRVVRWTAGPSPVPAATALT